MSNKTLNRFTLLELLSACALLCILAGVFIPVFHRIQNSARRNSTDVMITCLDAAIRSSCPTNDYHVSGNSVSNNATGKWVVVKISEINGQLCISLTDKEPEDDEFSRKIRGLINCGNFLKHSPKGQLIDEWGTPIYYRFPGEGGNDFNLISAGNDNFFGVGKGDSPDGGVFKNDAGEWCCDDIANF